MKYSIKDWKDLHNAEPTDVVAALFFSARDGDWESIQAASRAGMLSPTLDSRIRVQRMAVAASILDSAVLPDVQKSAVKATLQKWVKGFKQDDRDAILFHCATHSPFSPEGFSAVLEAGADPYAPGPADRSGEECLLAIMMTGDIGHTKELMVRAYGGGPITHRDMLPSRFAPSPHEGGQLNLLERCARVHRYDLTDWIHSRIVPGTQGEEILLDLGDKVIAALGFRPDGADVYAMHHSQPVADDTDTSYALRYLAAKPRLRDPSLWENIAKRPMRTRDEENFSLIDWIATDLSEPKSGNSASMKTRRERMPRILDQFIEHGVVDLDARVRWDKTLLMHAALQGETDWVEYLLEKGVDVSIKSIPSAGGQAYTAAELAANAGHGKCAQMINAFAASKAISRVISESRRPGRGTP